MTCLHRIYEEIKFEIKVIVGFVSMPVDFAKESDEFKPELQITFTSMEKNHFCKILLLQVHFKPLLIHRIWK